MGGQLGPGSPRGECRGRGRQVLCFSMRRYVRNSRSVTGWSAPERPSSLRGGAGGDPWDGREWVGCGLGQDSSVVKLDGNPALQVTGGPWIGQVRASASRRVSYSAVMGQICGWRQSGVRKMRKCRWSTPPPPGGARVQQAKCRGPKQMSKSSATPFLGGLSETVKASRVRIVCKVEEGSGDGFQVNGRPMRRWGGNRHMCGQGFRG